MKEPITMKERIMTSWQDGARKDIERAFGILQSKFQWIARHINLYNLNDISTRVATCLILHNMCVSDRVMDGDVNACYDNSNSLEKEYEMIVAQDKTVLSLQDSIPRDHEPRTGVQFMHPWAARMSTERAIWKDLQDVTEHATLHVAISDLKLSERP